jgi:hypothetical protein
MKFVFDNKFLVMGVFSMSQNAFNTHTDTSRYIGIEIDPYMCMTLIMYCSQYAQANANFEQLIVASIQKLRQFGATTRDVD